MKNFWMSSYSHFSNRQKLILILLLNLLLGLPGLWVPYYNTDELTNAIYARFINNHELGMRDFLGNTYLLTHYLYAWVYRFFSENSLVPIHVVHTFWKMLTLISLYWTGKQFRDAQTGLWAAIFYCVYSTCFMSKDFHTPSAESFSLLPAVLAAGCIFRFIQSQKNVYLVLSALCIAVATFFKAPMGVMLIAANLWLFVRWQGCFRNMLVLNFVFVAAMLVPALLVEPFGSGFALMLEKLNETQATYINTHSGISFLYWFLKFLIRTLMIMVPTLVMSVFAVYELRFIFHLKKKCKDEWQKIFFLCMWLLLIWFAVAIGKRVFYHYYVFLLAPLALLGGVGIRNFDLQKNREMLGFTVFKYIRKFAVLLIFLPGLGFFIEGALNFSTLPPNLDESISYINQNTKPGERIYVWGDVPQLYFFSDRLPSTVHFWSNLLAGSSPGSPAMEYVRATRDNLKVGEMLAKDFTPKIFKSQRSLVPQSMFSLHGVSENELFTASELLERMDHYYWQLVFQDFLHKPPVLFVDTSLSNIRGFGYYPIQKYELLKRFVLDNYRLEKVVDQMVIYRLKR
jgi:hypothetical protein